MLTCLSGVAPDEEEAAAVKVFLLSPARASGQRMGLLFRPGAGFALARDFQARGAALGELFQFASGLYFRGKLAYARAFGSGLVIAPGRGLLHPETRLMPAELRAMGEVPVDLSDARYRLPLERDVAALSKAGGQVVLLGSIATGKYADVLLEALGDRLLFPREFVGRGDMSRGGLLLRAARSGVELEYEPLKGAVRHGKRPARLPRL
jgi:hypothetical protein